MTGEDALRVAALSGGISFAAAVVAVVVGQVLGQWLQRRADGRRWEREERDRRRIRAEQAAETILDQVQAAADFCRKVASAVEPRVFPTPDELRQHHNEIRRAAVRVPEAALRAAAEKAADLLVYYQPAQMEQETYGLVWVLQREIEAAVGAYLRGEPVPPTPGVDRAHQEVEEYHDWIDRMIAEPADQAESAT